MTISMTTATGRMPCKAVLRCAVLCWGKLRSPHSSGVDDVVLCLLPLLLPLLLGRGLGLLLLLMIALQDLGRRFGVHLSIWQQQHCLSVNRLSPLAYQPSRRLFEAEERHGSRTAQHP